jgi:hypothetical protein
MLSQQLPSTVLHGYSLLSICLVTGTQLTIEEHQRKAGNRQESEHHETTEHIISTMKSPAYRDHR